MRTCSECKRALPEGDFYKSGRKIQARCKACFNRYCIDRWRRIKAEEVERMGGICADCGGRFHPDLYDFHHLDPSEKEYQWTKLRLFSAERRQTELAKCVLLCANCHRARHIVFPLSA